MARTTSSKPRKKRTTKKRAKKKVRKKVVRKKVAKKKKKKVAKKKVVRKKTKKKTKRKIRRKAKPKGPTCDIDDCNKPVRDGAAYCSRGCRNIGWIQDNCLVPDGRLVGQRVVLLPFQRKSIRGTYNSPTRRSIMSFGRKNGKTALSAMLLLLHLYGPEARLNTELSSTALSRDQAAILHRLASKMVRLSADLNAHIVIRETVKQLFCPSKGTLYQALSADAAMNVGGSPVFTVHDELGQIKGPRHPMYEAIETGMSAHDEPLSIVISTQAPTDADLLSVLIDDAMAGHDPETKVFLYTSDKEDDPFAEETIKKANPAYGVFQNEKELQASADSAKRMPSREAAYRNLNLNQRVEAENPFVTQSVWAENGGEHEQWGLSYGGLDLSETNDLTAFVLVSPKNGVYSIKSRFWLPEDGLEERSRQDRVPYDLWHKQGFLHVTPGRSVEYRYVAEYLARLFDSEDIRKIAFDRWNMRHLRPWLVEAGLSEAFIDDRFVDFGQGYVSMSPALRTLEALLLNASMRHENHPILTMCAANAVVKMDEAGNRKLDKKKSRGRIDGMVSLAMASATAAEESQSAPVFPVDPLKFVEDLHGQGSQQITT